MPFSPANSVRRSAPLADIARVTAQVSPGCANSKNLWRFGPPRTGQQKEKPGDPAVIVANAREPRTSILGW